MIHVARGSLASEGCLKRNRAWHFLVAAWAVALGVGVVLVWQAKLRPGALGRDVATWPADTTLPRNSGAPQVIMFAHPRCPCTLASLDELERAMAQSGSEVAPVIVFNVAAGTPETWAHGASWTRAMRIPRARVVIDRDGREAERFGAATSGHVFVFGGDGERVFSGGVTPARGHVGEGPGREGLIAALTDERVAAAHATPVFGCPMRDQP